MEGVPTPAVGHQPIIWPNTYPPAKMGIWDFSISGLSINSWSPTLHPPTHLQKWEFVILAFLDSTSKVDHCHPPCTYENGNLGFQHFWTQHQKLVTNPSPTCKKWEFEILAFLDSVSKVGHHPPHPPPTCENGNLGF